MNPQAQTLITSALKIIGTLLVAHGAKNVGSALMTEPIIEMVMGAASAVWGLYWSWKKSKEIPVVATATTLENGDTQFLVKPANAVITSSDPTPKNITAEKPSTIQTVVK